jgi:ABC-type transport system involved in cytochrome c biogenesis permease component
MKTFALMLGTTIVSFGTTVGAALACEKGFHEALVCILSLPSSGCIKWAELCLPN